MLTLYAKNKCTLDLEIPPYLASSSNIR